MSRYIRFTAGFRGVGGHGLTNSLLAFEEGDEWRCRVELMQFPGAGAEAFLGARWGLGLTNCEPNAGDERRCLV